MLHLRWLATVATLATSSLCGLLNENRPGVGSTGSSTAAAPRPAGSGEVSDATKWDENQSDGCWVPLDGFIPRRVTGSAPAAKAAAAGLPSQGDRAFQGFSDGRMGSCGYSCLII